MNKEKKLQHVIYVEGGITGWHQEGQITAGGGCAAKDCLLIENDDGL